MPSCVCTAAGYCLRDLHWRRQIIMLTRSRAEWAREAKENVKHEQWRIMSSVTQGFAHFCTRVAGVTYENRDGSSRQEAIQNCRCYEQVYLEPEPDNPVDSNAIRVVRGNDEQTGYLRADLAGEVANDLQQGWVFVAFVSAVLTPDDVYDTFGLELAVFRVPQAATARELCSYVDSVWPEFSGRPYPATA